MLEPECRHNIKDYILSVPRVDGKKMMEYFNGENLPIKRPNEILSTKFYVPQFNAWNDNKL